MSRAWKERNKCPLASVMGLFGLLAAQSLSSPLNAQGEKASCRADYTIEARLDGETKQLSGELWLDWSNRSADTVQDLRFHLYLNAFSNNRSTHLHESQGELRGVKVKEGWGWSQVTEIGVLDASGQEQDVSPSFNYVQPDDGREDDRTVFSVDLPSPVPPGGQARIHIKWNSQLPRVRRRTGYKDDFLLVAQWFPKLGVYESGSGWNCHQFHKNTEFYADYGTYEVTLDLPSEYQGRVSASGAQYSGELYRDRYLVSFRAPGKQDIDRKDAFGLVPMVHDFAWTASPHFVVEHRIFNHSEWAERYASEVQKVEDALAPGDEVQLRNVDVTILVSPEHADQIERHYDATCAALFFYGLWFGEYPYQHITVIDPAFGASAAGGMEYPTLFTCGTALHTTQDMQRPEGVTVHECGHQFWYGLVGNNEPEFAWLDEGFNSYTDSEVLWRHYGAQRETTSYAGLPFSGRAVSGMPGGGGLADALVGKAFRIPLPYLPDLDITPLPASGFLDLWRDQPALTFVPEYTDPRWQDRATYLTSPDEDPVMTSAWKYVDHPSYRVNSYYRPAVVLRSLPGVIGHGPFLRGMRRYAREWRYRHPQPGDFFSSFQAGAGVDVDWYFKELFMGTGTVDWSVSVSQAERSEPQGFFQSEGGAFIERQHHEGEDPQPAPQVIEVELRRSGELCLDLPVQLTFADGSQEDLVWTRAEQQAKKWLRITREGPAELHSVVLDPKRSYFIDSDMSNNQWYQETESLTGWRWGERALSQYQRYFHWIAGFGG